MDMSEGSEVKELAVSAEGTTRASLELLYNIGREFAAALDLRTVLQRVLFLSMKNVGAMSGSIVVMDDTGKPVESAIITGTQVHNHTTQRLLVTLDRGLAGWVVRNKQAVLIEDTSRDERWIARRYDPKEDSGPKSAVSAPLITRDKVIGVMTLVHHKPGFYTLEHLALVQAIADQAGIAVHNARLYAESQRQTRVMTALAESAAAITATLNLEDVLARILGQISQALRVKAVSLALIEEGTGNLVFRAAIGWERKDVKKAFLKKGQGITGWVAQEGRGAIVHEARNDARFDPEIDARLGFEAVAIACAPIRSRGQVIGVLEAINPSGKTFDPDALVVLNGIGGLAGTAIRHARLFERLQDAHESYRELFDDNIDPIFITNSDGRILEANRQAVRMTEYEKETLRTMNISQLHETNREKTGPDFAILSTGATISYESLLTTRCNIQIPIHVYLRQVKIEELSHLQWIFRDITERKNLDTLRDDLLSMIYHDLRSPLGNITSSLEVFDQMLEPESDPSMRAMLKIALRSTDRIQRLTNSLLDINRLEAGQPVGNRQPADAAALARDAVEAVLPTAENKRQQVSMTLPPDFPLILVDADMIRRVMTNLLENAVKYTPAGGKAEISGKYEDGWAYLWVQDSGPGIPASEHKRIFEKFTRLTGKDAPKGLGLGLAYCRLAVEGHGGRIWVESEPGEGSKFIFTVPLSTN